MRVRNLYSYSISTRGARINRNKQLINSLSHRQLFNDTGNKIIYNNNIYITSEPWNLSRIYDCIELSDDILFVLFDDEGNLNEDF